MAEHAPKTVVELPHYLRKAEKLLDEADREEVVLLVRPTRRVATSS